MKGCNGDETGQRVIHVDHDKEVVVINYHGLATAGDGCVAGMLARFPGKWFCEIPGRGIVVAGSLTDAVDDIVPDGHDVIILGVDDEERTAQDNNGCAVGVRVGSLWFGRCWGGPAEVTPLKDLERRVYWLGPLRWRVEDHGVVCGPEFPCPLEAARAYAKRVGAVEVPGEADEIHKSAVASSAEQVITSSAELAENTGTGLPVTTNDMVPPGEAWFTNGAGAPWVAPVKEFSKVLVLREDLETLLAGAEYDLWAAEAEVKASEEVAENVSAELGFVQIEMEELVATRAALASRLAEIDSRIKRSENAELTVSAELERACADKSAASSRLLRIKGAIDRCRGVL